MMTFKIQLLVLALLTAIQSASAGIFSTFRFSKLLYSFHACSHPGFMCPIPPCDLKSFDHPLCDHYLCRGGGRHKECTFIGNCNGNSDCIATAQYLDLDADYYADEEDSSTTDYSGNYNESYNEKTGGGLYKVTSTQNWLVYGILGGTLAAFMMMVIWRRRTINNDELGIELEPHGEDLNGAVARHHAQSQAAMV